MIRRRKLPPEHITDTPCYGVSPSRPIRWSTDDGSSPCIWVVRTGQGRYLGRGWATVTDPRRAMAWEVRAAADVAAALAGGEVVDLEVAAPPPCPPPEGRELCRDRIKRMYRNHAARNRQAAELDMPPVLRAMSQQEAQNAVDAGCGFRGLVSRMVRLLGCRPG